MPSSEMALLGKHFSGIRFLLLTLSQLLRRVFEEKSRSRGRLRRDFSEDLEMTWVVTSTNSPHDGAATPCAKDHRRSQ